MTKRLLGALLLSLVTFTTSLVADEVISEEIVSREYIDFFTKSSSGFTCIDPIPWNGRNYPVLGEISLPADNMIDQSGRLALRFGLFGGLHDDMNCVSMQALFDAMPSTLTAEKTVTRKIYVQYYAPHEKYSVLETVIKASLPIATPDNSPIVLESLVHSFVESFPYQESLPINARFLERIFPTSSDKRGLFCEAVGQGDEFSLVVAGFASRYLGNKTNIDRMSAQFSSQNNCEDARARLREHFQTIDPRNEGVVVSVDRHVEMVFDDAVDNYGNDICLQKYEETTSTKLADLDFVGKKKSRAMKTVPRALCGDAGK